MAQIVVGAVLVTSVNTVAMQSGYRKALEFLNVKEGNVTEARTKWLDGDADTSDVLSTFFQMCSDIGIELSEGIKLINIIGHNKVLTLDDLSAIQAFFRLRDTYAETRQSVESVYGENSFEWMLKLSLEFDKTPESIKTFYATSDTGTIVNIPGSEFVWHYRWGGWSPERIVEVFQSNFGALVSCAPKEEMTQSNFPDKKLDSHISPVSAPVGCYWRCKKSSSNTCVSITKNDWTKTLSDGYCSTACQPKP